MGSHCEALFENDSKIGVTGNYNRETLEGGDKPVEFSVDPGKELKIDMEFVDFSYFRFTIHAKDEQKNNYFEIRSIADFLLLQQVLEREYNLRLNQGRPNYRDFQR